MDSGSEPPHSDGDASPRATAPETAAHDGQVTLFGRYRIERELGRGGMGRVLLAFDTHLDTFVAVKLLPDVSAASAEAIENLRREVRRGMVLTHPGIARTHTFERDESGAAIVMEYIDGCTLADLKARQPGGCFDCAEILPWLEKLCAILDYAHHEARIVHRDLKPRNVMLTTDGKLKVADFGISSGISDGLSGYATRHDSSGTPPYMSPQQISGERASPSDDIYALGAMTYELLTGRPPFFRGTPTAIYYQVLGAVPPSLTARREELGVKDKAPIPSAWEETLAACLAKEPADRPQRAGEVLARLQFRPPPPVETRSKKSPRLHRRPPWLAITVPTAALVLVAAVLIAKNHPRDSGKALADSKLAAVATPAPATPSPPPTTPAPATPAPIAKATPEPVVTPAPMPATPAPIAMATPAPPPATPIPATPAPSAMALLTTVPRTTPIPAVAATPAPAKIIATKDRPWENSLGMRFVPVPIKGGPTSGQDVLFSIWDTRVRDYEAFAPAGKRPWQKPKFAQSPVHPAVNVSWEDAQAFCAWLTEREHGSGKLPASYHYRLPSDHEWSCAVGIGDREDALALPAGKSAQTADIFPWGGLHPWPPPPWAGNYADEAAKKAKSGYGYLAGYDDGFACTSPVGSFRANGLGLFDLGGNVWQWCEDWYDGERKYRVLRGASWIDALRENLLSSARLSADPGGRGEAYGFRCVLARDNPSPATGGITK